jgi:hypothetical protein
MRCLTGNDTENREVKMNQTLGELTSLIHNPCSTGRISTAGFGSNQASSFAAIWQARGALWRRQA